MNVGASTFPISFKLNKTDTVFDRDGQDQLVVVGCADCVWDDLKSISYRSKHVLVLNDIGIYFPGYMEHWATCHPNIINGGQKVRDQHRDHKDFVTHIPDYAVPKIPGYIWTIPKLAGTSGMFGVLIGLGLGYKRIILAGIPLTCTAHFWYPSVPVKMDKKGIRQSWERISNLIFEGRVRSLSGWTKELLGEPTEEWLSGE